jgi:hypothetical protein
VLEQPVHRHLVAVDDVEDAVGQPGLGEELGQEHGRTRVALGGLQHHGVAAGDGVGEHPERHHGREVERRDAPHHAEGLAQRPDVDARGHLG